MGKAYANKKTLEERNKNEYYPTPKVLVVELEKLKQFIFLIDRLRMIDLMKMK